MSASARYEPPNLPPPAATRLILLGLVLASGSAFAAYWWLVLELDSWPSAFHACTTDAYQPSTALAADRLSGFEHCFTRVELLQQVASLSGPVLLFLLALFVFVAAVPVRLRLWRVRRPNGPEASLVETFDGCVAESGLSRRPELLITPTGRGGGAWCYGRFPRYRIIVGRSLLFDEDALLPVLRHETAHLKARDVDRTRLALCHQGVFLVLFAAPLALVAALRPYSVGYALGWRLTAVLLLVILALLAALRAREHEADLLAAATSDAAGNESTSGIAYLVGRRADQRRSGWMAALVDSRAARIFGTHPSLSRRAAVLAEPSLLWRLSSAECLATGLIAGAMADEVTLFCGFLLPGRLELAYWIGAALVVGAVASVVVVNVWRAVAAGQSPGFWAATRAGAALGLGLIAGTQIDPRTATTLDSQFSRALSTAADMSLVRVDVWQQMSLVLSAVLIGIVLVHWSCAVASAAVRSPAGIRRSCSVHEVLAALVYAVPVGTWLLLSRVAAGSQSPVVAISILRGDQFWVGLAGSCLLGVVTIALAGARHRGRRPSLRPVVGTILGVVVAAAVPIIASSVLQATAGSAPILVGSAQSSLPAGTVAGPTPLPILPAQMVAGKGPLNNGLICRAIVLAGPQQWVEAAGRDQLASLLARTSDPILRAAAAQMQQSPNDGAVQSTAQTDVLARCDLLLRGD